MTDWQPAAFLFDLDGTIIDSSRPQLQALAKLVEDMGQKGLSPEELSRFIGIPTEHVIRELLPEGDHAHLMALLADYERERYHNLKIHEGVEDVLACIRQKGVPLAVVTSQVRTELVDTRKRIDLEAWVSVWVTADDVPRPKPDPAPVERALSLLEVLPASAIMIGDTPYDIEAGRRAGTKTAAALWGALRPEPLLAQRPDYRFDDPSEILRLIGE